jgi:hypothetical protein
LGFISKDTRHTYVIVNCFERDQHITGDNPATSKMTISKTKCQDYINDDWGQLKVEYEKLRNLCRQTVKKFPTRRCNIFSHPIHRQGNIPLESPSATG